MANSNGSPLREAFLWAVMMGAAVGVGGAIDNKWLGSHIDVGRDVSTAVLVAGVVAWGTKKNALENN